MLKKIVIGVLVGLVLVAGVAGVVVAAQVLDDSDDPIDDMFSRLAERLGLTRQEMLTELLDGKTLSDVMADLGLTPKDVKGSWHIKFVPAPKAPILDLKSIAEVLGMEPEALRQAIADGQSIADVVEAQGMDRETVMGELVAVVEAKIKAALDAGDLTDQQAEHMLDLLHSQDLGTDWMDIAPGRLAQRFGMEPRIIMHPSTLLADVAEVLGMEPAELRDLFEDGQTLSEIIAAQNLNPDEVFEQLKAVWVTRLEKVLDDKTLALERAEVLLEQMKTEDAGYQLWERLLEWSGPRERLPLLEDKPWRAPCFRFP